jgi:hypothetical protein
VRRRSIAGTADALHPNFQEASMIGNLLRHSLSTLAFGASSAALALCVAMTGLWLIGMATSGDTAVHLAAIQ